MSFSLPLMRVYIDASDPIATICLLVQLEKQPAVFWQWELPYLLWACSGTADTATWLSEQFRTYDLRTFRAVGRQPLRRLFHQALERHRKQHAPLWFTDALS